MNQSEPPHQRINSAGFPQPWGLYDPANEKDSCGIGFIARLDAQPEHLLVRNAIQILVNLEHRGAVGGDKSTGDGAGLLLQTPDRFFQEVCKEEGFDLPERNAYAVGIIFLPTDTTLRERCEKAFEEVAESEGAQVLGWRDVPVESNHLGRLSLSTMPIFRQVFLGFGSIPPNRFELKLYIIRRLVEKEIAAWQNVDASQFYVSSLSSFTINYKGLLTGTQLTTFYPDLGDPRFASAFALVHQRYSTNTLPTWSLAQPFRYLAHNGEINTLRGNINQMHAREALLESTLFGEELEKIKPVIVEGGSDSAT
ncbi:glutamate synthase subunit alpha, partial [bacterium]|nr:glutamate synthase subunit alpha [bacterium]